MIRKDCEKLIQIEPLDNMSEGEDFQTLQVGELVISSPESPDKMLKEPGKLKVAILTISDRCFNGEAQDTSGSALQNLINNCTYFEGKVVDQKCSPDDKECIQEVLMGWCDDLHVDLALTTGGTGLALRDVTPEAVKEIIEKEAPGISQQMIGESLKITPLAMLSRPVCGIRGHTLIITLPGSAKASQECLRFVAPAISHAIDLLQDQKNRVEKIHLNLHGALGIQMAIHDTNKELSSTDEDELESKAEVSKIARRARRSPYPIISVEQAQEKVLSKAFELPYLQSHVNDARGFALIDDIYAIEALPPFPASIKDGYAVVSTDGKGFRQVIGQSCAGSVPELQQVKPGTCMRVNTGAPIPLGADAVIQVEDTKIVRETDDGSEELEIELLKDPLEGQDIRPKGSDISSGELLLTAGMIIGPSEIGVMASAGVYDVCVYRKPVVAVLSTGNELQDPSKIPLSEGCIYDSNKVMLLSLLEQHSFPVIDSGIARDDPTSLFRAIRRALTKADILVTSGGVSMGDRDLLRPVLIADFNATIHFAQVFMKPGKPTTFATCNFNGTPKIILGLPGNPVSAIVTAHLYLLPLCRKISGHMDYQNTIIRAKLASKIRLDPRPEYHRAALSWSSADNLPTAHSTGNQMSSRLLSMASAQALLQLPPASEDHTFLPAGSVVEAVLLSIY